MGDWERKNLENELIMGRELTRQLQLQLNMPSSSRETHELLLQKILSSYEKALSMINSNGRLIHSSGIFAGMTYSSSLPSLSGSPRSDRDYERDEDPKDVLNKRKSSVKHVRVNRGIGLEKQLDDGFSWRKYDQKGIPGAKYPRGYYRCTHRIVEGCAAVKQIQRSDEDPNIFEITYFGRHTCTQMLDHEHHNSKQQEYQHLSQNLASNFCSDLEVITEGLHLQDQSVTAFNFPSTSNVEPGNHVFLPPSMVHNSFMGINNVSPSASFIGNANYFSASSSGIHQSFEGGNQSFRASDSDVKATASAITSPNIGMDFPSGNVDFDPKYFPLDN